MCNVIMYLKALEQELQLSTREDNCRPGLRDARKDLIHYNLLALSQFRRSSYGDQSRYKIYGAAAASDSTSKAILLATIYRPGAAVTVCFLIVWRTCHL
jgi:hypothetical protein